MFIVCSGLALAQPLEPGSWSAIRCWNWRRSPPPAKPITAPLWTRNQLLALVRSFEGSALCVIVAVAATGARRNKILALRWEDLDEGNKTLRIERALEETDAHGLRIKGICA